jgi:hypothetical protein
LERFFDRLAQRLSEDLVEEQSSSLNPPQRGLGVTGKKKIEDKKKKYFKKEKNG